MVWVQSMTDSPIRRRRFAKIAAATAAFGVAGCMHEDDDPAPPDDDDDDDDPPDDDDDDIADDNDIDEDDTDDDDDTDADTPETDVAIGGVIEGQNMHLVVEEIEFTEEVEGMPDALDETEYVLGTMALQNVTEDFISLSGVLSAQLHTDGDAFYEMVPVAVEEPDYNHGLIAPGEVIRSLFLFEIVEDSSGLVLEFEFDEEAFGLESSSVDIESEDDDPVTLEQELTVDIHAVGDTSEYSGIEVTVHDVEEGAEPDAEEAEPGEGHEYVRVDLSVTNGTEEEQTINTTHQIQGKDEEGWKYRVDWEASRAPEPEEENDNGDEDAEEPARFDEEAAIPPDETREGEILVAVAEGASPLYLTFDFSFWVEESEKHFWEIR